MRSLERIGATAMMFIRLSVWDGSAWWSYGGHPGTKAYPLPPSRLFQFHPEERWGMDVQTRRDTPRTVEDRV